MKHVTTQPTDATPITSTEVLGDPTWRSIADAAGDLNTRFGKSGQPNYRWPAVMQLLAKQTRSLSRCKAPDLARIAEAALTSEALAVVLCDDPAGYRNYAINPDGLRDLVDRVTTIQAAIRELAGAAAPGAVAAVIDATYSRRAANADGVRPSPVDDAATAYVAARAAGAAYAHGEAPEPERFNEFDAATALLREPPTDVGGIAVRLGYIIGQAFLHRAGDWDCPACRSKREVVEPPTDAEFAACGEGQNGGMDALFRALAHLQVGVEGLAKRQTADRAAWQTAVANYEAAQAEERRLGDLADAATAAVDADAPMPAILMESDATYRTEEQIMQANRLSPERRLEMLAAFRAWRAARAEAMERHQCDEAHERWDEYRQAHETLEALVDCPAPDMDALAYKVRAWLARAHVDRVGQDVDDVGTLAELLATAPMDGAWAPVRFYQDVLRMSGQRPDIVAAEPFDVEGWVDDFVAHPGHYLDGRGPVYIEPEAFPGGDVANVPPGRKAWSELTPALRAVVRSYASQQVKLGELPDPSSLHDADIPLLAAE